MKIFLSHKFTGEDIKELKITLDNITNILENSGHSVFCSITKEDFFQEQAWSVDAIYDYCLKEQENCDLILAFIRSEEKSLGMEKELEKAIEINQNMVLAIQETLDFSHFRDKARQTIEFDSLEKLYEQLKSL